MAFKQRAALAMSVSSYKMCWSLFSMKLFIDASLRRLNYKLKNPGRIIYTQLLPTCINIMIGLPDYIKTNLAK